VADTLHKALLREITDVLVTSLNLCAATSVSLTGMKTRIDQSREAVTRSRALLLRTRQR
jgi:hypothetical protein